MSQENHGSARMLKALRFFGIMLGTHHQFAGIEQSDRQAFDFPPSHIAAEWPAISGGRDRLQRDESNVVSVGSEQRQCLLSAGLSRNCSQ